MTNDTEVRRKAKANIWSIGRSRVAAGYGDPSRQPQIRPRMGARRGNIVDDKRRLVLSF